MRLTAIGGGHGLSNLLLGLKKYLDSEISRLSTIISVADNGGSTGILRKLYNIPAMGDIRRCMSVLSDLEEPFPSMFEYRFKKGEFKKHALGNLIITALYDLTGDFYEAIKYASKLWNIKASIIPSSIDYIQIAAKFSNGEIIVGEEQITEYGKNGYKVIDLWTEPRNPRVPKDAIDTILNSDVIVIGPGSLYTSILPNLVIEDIRNALKETNAIRIFVVNVMNQEGETDGFTVYNYLESLISISKVKPDWIIVNNNYILDGKVNGELVKLSEEDKRKISAESINIFARDVINLEDPKYHDPDKLARAIMELYNSIKG